LITIRPVAPGEERLLWNVFRSSVHEFSRSQYSHEQLNAWAPAQYPGDVWESRITRNRPFVAELDGVIAGFADLHPDGYIDQFFVSGKAGGKGVGKRLMQTLEAAAKAKNLSCMFSNVSLNAEPFFLKHGFVVQERQQVIVRGVTFDNARMCRVLSWVTGRDREGVEVAPQRWGNQHGNATPASD
jgi:putative acetyltransferase